MKQNFINWFLKFHLTIICSVRTHSPSILNSLSNSSWKEVTIYLGFLYKSHFLLHSLSLNPNPNPNNNGRRFYFAYSFWHFRWVFFLDSWIFICFWFASHSHTVQTIFCWLISVCVILENRRCNWSVPLPRTNVSISTIFSENGEQFHSVYKHKSVKTPTISSVFCRLKFINTQISISLYVEID